MSEHRLALPWHARPAGLLAVGAALLVLTTGTLLLSRFPLGGASLPLALAFAGIKALLIGFVFMHLLERRQGSGLLLVISAALMFVAVLTAIVVLETSQRAVPTTSPGPFPLEALPGLGPPPPGPGGLPLGRDLGAAPTASPR